MPQANRRIGSNSRNIQIGQVLVCHGSRRLLTADGRAEDSPLRRNGSAQRAAQRVLNIPGETKTSTLCGRIMRKAVSGIQRQSDCIQAELPRRARLIYWGMSSSGRPLSIPNAPKRTCGKAVPSTTAVRLRVRQFAHSASRKLRLDSLGSGWLQASPSFSLTRAIIKTAFAAALPLLNDDHATQPNEARPARPRPRTHRPPRTPRIQPAPPIRAPRRRKEASSPRHRPAPQPRPRRPPPHP